MKNSNIEWTDHTFNPWEGCTKVSPGCAHCYAESRNKRFAGGKNWGAGAPRRRTSENNWKQPLRWNAACQENIDSGAPFIRPRVFCASLADWLDDEVPLQWLADLLELVRATPHLDWLLLTKRPQNWERRISALAELREVGSPQFLWEINWYVQGRPPSNVWIGTTVEDQTRADERIPALIAIPARIRFLSCEPLLDSVDLGLAGICAQDHRKGYTPIGHHIHWVICGGESGAGAREMNPDWARSLRDQCAAAQVAFFFKQWGKQAVGRSLDDALHDQFPTPR